MKNYQYLFLFLSLSLVSIVFAAEVETEVRETVQQEQEASVIIILKDEPGKAEITHLLEDLVLAEESADDQNILSEAPPAEYDFKVERKYSSIPGLSGTLSISGLEKLEDNPRVEKIFLNKVLRISLDTSIPLINANEVWNFSVGGYNITGKGETVCILDTGIDTDHPAFQDKIKSQYCYCSGNCCPGGFSTEANAEDDHGHGTHTAGIAAGNLTTYTGVAKDAGIYAVKVCNASGLCVTSDIISGMDRCSDTNNITAFNISVISISLGDTTQNNAYCNGDALAPSINTAVGRNISVVIAAGNSGYTAGISSPACVQNATPVGGVDDTDAISYNRGAILELLAPGVSITSATVGGGTTSLSGTSMSAPHAAGAVAIFRQYWRLAYSRTPTVDEVKRKFMITGKLIDDSSNSGKNYSRIDILAALQPFMNFTDTSAANNSFLRANNSFLNITSDVNLTNSLLEWRYSNGSAANLTLIKINGTNFYLNITHLIEGVDTYLIYGNDTVGTIGISMTRTATIDTTLPAVAISNPANSSNFSSGVQAFNTTISDVNMGVVLFQFNNGSGNYFNVTPANVSGNWNTNLNLARLTEGLQLMTVYANDSAGNLNNTQLVEFTVDRTPPAVTFVSPTTGQNYTLASGNQTFNATVTDALLTVQRVQFSFDNASGNGFNVTAANQSGHWTAPYNVSSLANGTHTITLIANDTAGNVNKTSSITFTLDSTPLSATLLTPVNANLNSSTTMTFNCSARDYLELANMTLYGNWSSGWHANETKTMSGSTSSVIFSKTLRDGAYVWNCLAYDINSNSVFAPSNFTVAIDTAAPIISSVSSGTPSSTSATITWTTSENANATVNYGITESLGTISSTTSRSTSQSRTLSSLTASTAYFYNVTSCDALGNCLTNGPFSFTTAAVSGDSSGSSSSGGGGGGGSGGGGSSSSSSTASDAEEAGDETTSAEESSSGGGTGVDDSITEGSVSQPLVTFSQSVSFSKGQPSVVTINEEKIGIKEIEVNSKVDKETTFKISYLSEKPAEISEVRNPYQYFEITVDLTADEIEKVTATFEVPTSWLTENNFLKETVSLNTFEETDGKWKKLSTKLIEEKGDIYVYRAKLKHFSYFSITADSELEFSWFKNLIPPQFGTRGFVIFGMILLIAFLLALYWFLHRGEEQEDRV